MKVQILSNIRNFKLHGCLQVLIGKLNFISDKSIIQNFFYKQQLIIDNVGTQFFNTYKESDIAFQEIILSKSELLGIVSRDDFEKLSNKILHLYTCILSDYLAFLWFVKDNSVTYDNAILYINDCKVVASSLNYLPISNCFGEFLIEEFSEEEMNFCFNVAQLYNTNVFSNKKPDKENIVVNRIDTNSNDSNYNDNNRIERAFIFLQSLRATVLLPQKIALYIPVFECLFSTDSNEITHKVSERVAQYIGSDKMDKLEIFKTVKECYDLRSKFFHGSPLSKKHNTKEKQKELAKKIDSICRKVFLKAITHDSEVFKSDDKKLSDFFDSLIFS